MCWGSWWRRCRWGGGQELGLVPYSETSRVLGHTTAPSSIAAQHHHRYPAAHTWCATPSSCARVLRGRIQRAAQPGEEAAAPRAGEGGQQGRLEECTLGGSFAQMCTPVCTLPDLHRPAACLRTASRLCSGCSCSSPSGPLLLPTADPRPGRQVGRQVPGDAAQGKQPAPDLWRRTWYLHAGCPASACLCHFCSFACPLRAFPCSSQTKLQALPFWAVVYRSKQTEFLGMVRPLCLMRLLCCTAAAWEVCTGRPCTAALLKTSRCAMSTSCVCCGLRCAGEGRAEGHPRGADAVLRGQGQQAAAAHCQGAGRGWKGGGRGQGRVCGLRGECQALLCKL